MRSHLYGRDGGVDALFLYPLHLRTGSRGYFSNRESVNDSWHCRNVDARSDVMSRACAQSPQSPRLSAEIGKGFPSLINE
jgi:hypothetical protein